MPRGGMRTIPSKTRPPTSVEPEPRQLQLEYSRPSLHSLPLAGFAALIERVDDAHVLHGVADREGPSRFLADRLGEGFALQGVLVGGREGDGFDAAAFEIGAAVLEYPAGMGWRGVERD